MGKSMGWGNRPIRDNLIDGGGNSMGMGKSVQAVRRLDTRYLIRDNLIDGGGNSMGMGMEDGEIGSSHQVTPYAILKFDRFL